MTMLRRIYDAPELFQLLATFGVTLTVEDLVLIVWGPDELLGPRAPGFKGAVRSLRPSFPDLRSAADRARARSCSARCGCCSGAPAGACWCARRRWTAKWSAALGVNQKWLFTSVFALGVFLAAFGGALALPREAANHTMDLPVITEALVVVVIGGLGSVLGTFRRRGHRLRTQRFRHPRAARRLVGARVRRDGDRAGRAAFRSVGGKDAPARPPAADVAALAPVERRAARGSPGWRSRSSRALPLVAGAYWLGVASEVLIFVIFAASLHFLVGVGGLVSFGHAAYFGLGSYGAALALKRLGLPMGPAIAAGVAARRRRARCCSAGSACATAGVYSAMLTLAFAADRLVGRIPVDRRHRRRQRHARRLAERLGGDAGALLLVDAGARAPSASRRCASSLFSPFGYALRAVRDNEARAEAIGLGRHAVQWAGFVDLPAAFAALAGALYAFLKGSVFPDNLGIPLSVDGLAMVLIGGVDTVLGGVVGAAVFRTLSIWMISHTDYSRLVIGAADRRAGGAVSAGRGRRFDAFARGAEGRSMSALEVGARSNPIAASSPSTA